DRLADTLAARNPAVRVIHEGRRNGFGAALKLGYKEARMDWIWLVTPDLPFPLNLFPDAIPLLDRYDAVLSYRTEDDRTGFRKIQSACFNLLVKVAFGLRPRCINSAFKILPRDFVQGIALQSSGWTIDVELTYLLKKAGLSFTEIGTPLIERRAGQS